LNKLIKLKLKERLEKQYGNTLKENLKELKK